MALDAILKIKVEELERQVEGLIKDIEVLSRQQNENPYIPLKDSEVK